MHVLDLGGTPESWSLCPTPPARLTILNTFAQESERANVVIGDACDPPASIKHEQFDLVYSNSVLEHVGNGPQRERFAENAVALGDHHWVQTPNYGFPIEPHFLFPGLHYLPTSLAARCAHRWPFGHFAGILSLERARRALDGIHLLRSAELSELFPESAILRERVGPLTKSLIAVR